jgi:hypothetical protein
MLSQSRFSYLVEISQKMIEAVKAMQSAYSQFPALIREEHDMIKAHTYSERLEEVMKEKHVLGDEIAAAFDELQQLAQQVYMIWGEADCEGQASFPGDLSNCVEMLRGIYSTLSHRATELQLGILNMQIEKLAQVHSSFKEQSEQIKPQLEMNREAISAVAKNYQMSTKILLEMAEQAQATYTPGGQQSKPKLSNSTISIKA